jgi:hypothetical protein
MFEKFEQKAKQSENCVTSCQDLTYTLQARVINYFHYTIFSIQGDVIVTEIKLFYK